MLDRVTFGHKDAKKILEDFVVVKVDADEQVNNSLYKHYEVEILPTVLFLTHDGKELARSGMEAVEIDDLKKLASKARKAAKKLK